MKLKSMLTIGAIATAPALFAQTYDWRSDTLSVGVGYAQDAYLHLDSGQVKTVANNNWDLGFPGAGSAFRYSVYTNNFGNGLSGKLLDLEKPAADFGTDLTADTAGKVTLHNDAKSWNKGAFGTGWGEYDISDHSINGTGVFAYIASHGAYQIVIKKYKAATSPAERYWIIKVANLDGTDTGTYTIYPHAEGYSTENLFYFSLADREFSSRDAKYGTWHLLATKYGDNYGSSPGVFSTTGILTSPTVGIATVHPLVPNDADHEDYTDFNDTTKNVIGGSYKYVDMAGDPAGWKLYDSLSYFIKGLAADENAGDIWQVYMDYFPLGTSGDVKIGIQVRKVYEAPTTSVPQEALIVNTVVVAPNPTNGLTNIVIDAKSTIKNAQFSITDITGKRIASFHKDINTGLQQFVLDASQYPAGMYIINVRASGLNFSEKLIVK